MSNTCHCVYVYIFPNDNSNRCFGAPTSLRLFLRSRCALSRSDWRIRPPLKKKRMASRDFFAICRSSNAAWARPDPPGTPQTSIFNAETAIFQSIFRSLFRVSFLSLFSSIFVRVCRSLAVVFALDFRPGRCLFFRSTANVRSR